MDTSQVTITCYSNAKKDYSDDLLRALKRIERKVFPAGEVFNFELELKKQNTSLICATEAKAGTSEIVGYLVSTRTKRIAFLHKICVQVGHRRKGIAKQMISALEKELTARNCESLYLWVDEARKPARSLYGSRGFQEVDRVDNYYSPGRTGVKMVLQLDSPD